MSREALDNLLAVACLCALAFLMVLIASPDMVAGWIEAVLA